MGCLLIFIDDFLALFLSLKCISLGIHSKTNDYLYYGQEILFFFFKRKHLTYTSIQLLVNLFGDRLHDKILIKLFIFKRQLIYMRQCKK